MLANKARKAVQNKGQCHTETCEDPAAVSGLCHACYQFDYYWTRKPPSKRRERVKNLTKYQKRMEALHPPRVHLATNRGRRVP